MKVFFGWSGSTSHKVALAFHGWLPNVIQAIKPYISSEDIAKGARWSTEIAKELESSNFGIIFVTKENVSSPWINFEAGALSREIGKSFVAPFLFDLRAADVQGPLAQFQHTANTKDEILKLVSDINGRQGESQLSKEALETAFDVWWPSLEVQLGKLAKEAASAGPAPPKPDPEAMLAELLETTRAMQRESGSLSYSVRTELDEAFLGLRALSEEINKTLSTVLRKVDRLEADLSLAPYSSINPLGSPRGIGPAPLSGIAPLGSPPAGTDRLDALAEGLRIPGVPVTSRK